MKASPEVQSQKQRDNDQNASQEDEKPRNKTIAIDLLAQVTTLSWNLVIPIVGGVLLGAYLDNRLDSGFTWTLSLLVLGVIIALSNLYNLYIEHGKSRLESQEDKTKVKNDKKI